MSTSACHSCLIGSHPSAKKPSLRTIAFSDASQKPVPAHAVVSRDLRACLSLLSVLHLKVRFLRAFISKPAFVEVAVTTVAVPAIARVPRMQRTLCKTEGKNEPCRLAQATSGSTTTPLPEATCCQDFGVPVSAHSFSGAATCLVNSQCNCCCDSSRI